MAKYEYINATICESLKAEKTKTAARVLNWLDLDRCSITKSENYYFFECYAWPMPNYVYYYLRRYIPKVTGLKYALEDKPIF